MKDLGRLVSKKRKHALGVHLAALNDRLKIGRWV